MLPDLAQRVDEVIADAGRSVRRGYVLVGAITLVREPETMATRCAWCRRLSFGGEWIGFDELPRFLPADLGERTTHGICPDCFERVDPANRS